MSREPIDLSLVSMDDIWEELKKRFDACLLVDLKEYDEQREGAQISYHGGKFICIGLAEYAKEKILKDSIGTTTKEGEA